MERHLENSIGVEVSENHEWIWPMECQHNTVLK